MKNEILGKRVKELRQSNGYSQEFLAEEAGLNLRTIQRIESGTTIPRGDTLSRLSAALKVSPDELLDWSKEEDKGQLLLINLAALSLIFNPFIGIILTLALWISKKDKIVHANKTGKKILNFQITWLLFLSLVIISFVAIVITYGGGNTTIDCHSQNGKIILSATIIFLFGLAFYYVFSIILILVNTYRIQKDQPVVYKPAFRFIK